MNKSKIVINSILSSKYYNEKLNGRDHLVVNMRPIVGDTMMNELFYPDSEVTKSYMQLNNLLAPVGHPKVNGEDVSALNPLAINKHSIGAYIRNPTKSGKEVLNELVIDIEKANQSDDGKETVRRIQNGESVGVSTGLTADITNKEVRNIKYDHVAILLNESPAGGDQTRIINCNLNEAKNVTNQEGNNMPEEKKLGDLITNANADEALKLVRNQLSRSALDEFIKNEVAQSGEFIINKEQKVSLDYFEANKDKIVNAVKAEEEKLTALRNSVVKATGMTMDEAKTMPESALQKVINSLGKSNDYSFNAPGQAPVDVDTFLANNKMGVHTNE